MGLAGEGGKVNGRHFEVDLFDNLDRKVVQAVMEDSADGFALTPFQRRGFVDAFYRHAAQSHRPLLVRVRARGEGRTAMLLPLLLRNGALRSIEATDLGLSDYVAPVMADWFDPRPAEMQRIWKKILHALPPADVVSLKKMPELIGQGRPNPLLMLPHVSDMSIGTKTLDLRHPEAPTHYRRSGLYKDGMRQLRKLREIGEVEFRIAATRDEALDRFDDLVAQRMERFRALGRPDALTRPEVQAFYSEIIADGVSNGSVMFGGLYLDGKCIATDLGLIENDTHHGIFTSMCEGNLRRYSPGTIAFMLILDETVARGIGYYDIGVGEFPYKDRLEGSRMRLFEHHQALSLRGHAALAEAAVRRAVRSGLARYPALRPSAERLRQRLRRFRNWSPVAAAGVLEWPGLAQLAHVVGSA